jgi:hypothetical protein
MNRRNPYLMAHAHRCLCQVCEADRIYTLRGVAEILGGLVVLALMVVAGVAVLLLGYALTATPVAS